jgi:chromosome segregation ATPase
LETLRNNLTNAFYSKDQELITSQEQLKQVNQQVAELTAELDVVQAQRDARPTVAQLTVAQDQIQILNELLVEKNAELDEKDIEFEQLENEITSKNNENQQLANDLLTLTTERDTLVNSIREELAREREKTNNLELELVERNNHTCPIVEDKQSIEREIVKEIIDQLNLTLSEEVSVKEVITELKALIDKKPIEVPVEIEKEKIVKVENTSLTNSLKQEISELEKELSLVKSKGDLLMPITCAITIPLLLIIMVLLKKRRLVGKKR